jgi:hypothetical protein
MGGGKAMYDELVKRIWECASGECFNCSQYTPTTNASVCQKELMKQAADAIEELSKDRDNWKTTAKEEREMYWHWFDNYQRDVPRWIPVTERLPEKTGTYLAWTKWDLTEADEEPSAYPIEYDAEEEAFGWWKSYYDAETLGWAGEDFIRYEGITHWMPLPEPPKEET